MSDETKSFEPLTWPSFIEISSYELEARKARFEEQKHELEILTFLHSAGLQRWKDRRDNEWKLNYAIWAAIAGLDALLLLHRDALYISPWWTIPGILLCALCHGLYLLPTTERAISEIELQCDVEHGIRVLLSNEAIRNEVKTRHLGGAIRKYEIGTTKQQNWLWKHYGVFAPLGITIALLVLAGILLGTAGSSKASKLEHCDRCFQFVRA